MIVSVLLLHYSDPASMVLYTLCILTITGRARPRALEPGRQRPPRRASRRRRSAARRPSTEPAHRRRRTTTRRRARAVAARCARGRSVLCGGVPGAAARAALPPGVSISIGKNTARMSTGGTELYTLLARHAVVRCRSPRGHTDHAQRIYTYSRHSCVACRLTPSP